jgi:DNA polymerase (family 10)
MTPALKNSEIAEFLAKEAENAKPPLNRALKRAARAAHLWPEEVGNLIAAGRSLTELAAIGPFLQKLVQKWMKKAPAEIHRPDPRQQFLTWTEAQTILAPQPNWLKNLKGDLQMHTEWSDGTGTILDMAKAGIDRAYEYIAITDHAKKLKIAGGIDEEELRQQTDEIKAVNEELSSTNFRILRSIELNLDLQGNGDLDSRALKQLDIVLGAFHLSLRRTDDQTGRYLAALNNPQLNILGHPRGRIYNYRLGLKADWSRVFALAAKNDKAIEVDSYPDRQDLNLDLLKLAKTEGCRISIGTDAHHPWQLEFIDFGLAAALAAKIPKERVLNFMTRRDLLAWASKHR